MIDATRSMISEMNPTIVEIHRFYDKNQCKCKIKQEEMYEMNPTTREIHSFCDKI